MKHNSIIKIAVTVGALFVSIQTAHAEPLSIIARILNGNADEVAQDAAIAQNASDIVDNRFDIDDNTTEIVQNASDITDNASDIASNINDITSNISDIADNRFDIDNNTTEIVQNASDITDNALNPTTVSISMTTPPRLFRTPVISPTML